MWSQFITIIFIVPIVMCDVQESQKVPPGFKRILGEGVTSLGYKFMYGNKDINDLNAIIEDFEKRNEKQSEKLRFNLDESLPPLPAIDVKCLMSVDRYCSKEMAATKKILIQAVQENCTKCSATERATAGKVMASMLAHNPVAWKYFLSRCTLLTMTETPRKLEKPRKLMEAQYFEDHLLRDIEEVEPALKPSGEGYIMPGVNVTIKGFRSKK